MHSQLRGFKPPGYRVIQMRKATQKPFRIALIFASSTGHSLRRKLLKVSFAKRETAEAWARDNWAYIQNKLSAATLPARAA